VGSKAWLKQWQRGFLGDVPTPRQHMICLRLQMNLIVPVTLCQGAFSFDHFTQLAFCYRSGWVLKSNPVRARSKSLMKLIYIGEAVRGWKFLLYGGLWYDTPLQACRVRKLSRSVSIRFVSTNCTKVGLCVIPVGCMCQYLLCSRNDSSCVCAPDI